MELSKLRLSPSGLEASLITDIGIFRVTRADLRLLFGVSDPDELMLPLVLDENEEGSLRFCADRLEAVQYALHILSFGDKSERDLVLKMKQKGFTPVICEAACELLKKNGYLSDEDYCRRRCELLFSGKHFGRKRLISELLGKGFAYDLVIKTVDDLLADHEEDSGEQLRTLFDKYTSDGVPADPKGRKKLFDKLLRLGYGYEEVRSLFDELPEEE